MGDRKLATYVTVEGTTYPAGTDEDDLPEDVVEKIDNPEAWAVPGEDEDEELGTEGYAAHTVKELLQFAKERDLELTSTKKSDVIAALEADDANDAG